jgi:uncharacterized membrane protein
MKKKILLILILVAITVFVSVPYFSDEIIEGDDTSYHINRIIAIADAIRTPNDFGLIHSNLLNGFGYASPLFYPQLFLYIPAILVAVGVDSIVSYKIFIVLINFATACITYYSMNRLTKSSKKSLLITYIYVFAMYRLGDIYVRCALRRNISFDFYTFSSTRII